MKRILFFTVMILTTMVIFAQSDELAVQSSEAPPLMFAVAPEPIVLPPLSDELAPWFAAYEQARTASEKLVYIRSVIERDFEGAENFYARALDRLLVLYPNLRTPYELDAASTGARLLVAKLGEAQYTDAALNIWRVVEIIPEAITRAEAMIALGRTGNTTYLPHVIQVLTDTNYSPQSDLYVRENSERLAYGAIRSLEFYQAPEAYLPVFIASVGWYSQRIRSQAANTLAIILDDPIETLLEVVLGSGHSYHVKHAALQTSENSHSSNEDKARIAVAALNEGWRNQTGNNFQSQELFQMRILAMSMIRSYGTDDPTVYTSLDRSYREGSYDERMAVIQTLASLGTEDSAQLLSSYLRTVHVRRLSNILTPSDERLVRAIIPALGYVGATGRTHSRPILLQVEQSYNWNIPVRNLASNALRQVDS